MGGGGDSLNERERARFFIADADGLEGPADCLEAGTVARELAELGFLPFTVKRSMLKWTR